MTISHWGVFPGIAWQRQDGLVQWRELSFDFFCLGC